MVFREGDIVLINGTPEWSPDTCNVWVDRMNQFLKDGREYEVISVYDAGHDPKRYSLKDCLDDEGYISWIFPEGALVLI